MTSLNLPIVGSGPRGAAGALAAAGTAELIHLVELEFRSETALRRLAVFVCDHPAHAEVIFNLVETVAA